MTLDYDSVRETVEATLGLHRGTPTAMPKRSGESKLSAREVEAAKLLLLRKFGK